MNKKECELLECICANCRYECASCIYNKGHKIIAGVCINRKTTCLFRKPKPNIQSSVMSEAEREYLEEK